jgi:hypothetical protein
MKSSLTLLVVVVVLVGLSGCCHTGGFLSPHGRCLIDGSCGHCSDCPDTCISCDANDAGGCCGSACGESCGCCEECEECDEPYCQDYVQDECCLMDRIRARRYVNPGPPTGAVTYPYYPVRGPRDFLASGPRAIGP